MSIAAAINKKELTKSVSLQFVNQSFQVALVNAPGTVYNPGATVTATFLANEIAEGTGGYTRQVISYLPADLQTYADEGVPLARKAATFTHNGGATTYQFTHVALLRVAVGTGSISGTTMTITAQSSGLFEAGYALRGTGITSGTSVSTILTGTGGVGTFTVSSSQNVASTTITGAEIVSVAPLSSQALMSDGNQAVFYFDLKQFGYYQV